MALAEVEIPFCKPPIPFDVASNLLACVTFPTDTRKLRHFAIALCRHQYIIAEKQRRTGDSSPFLVKPITFFQTEQFFQQRLNHGVEKVRICLIAARDILGPHVRAHENRRKTLRRISIPTVDEAISSILEREGLSNISSFESDVWDKLRPVCHLAFALSELVDADQCFWRDRKGAIKDVLTPFANEDVLEGVLARAGSIRELLPSFKYVRFSEDTTYRFIAKKIELELLMPRAETSTDLAKTI